MPQVHRAAWVLPIAGPPLRDGWVSVERGRIAAVGGGPPPRGSIVAGGSYDRAILPGLVNAHCHLELSWLRGLVPPCEAMPAWVGRMMSLRRSREPSAAAHGAAADQPDPIADAIAEAGNSGTALVGDITNSLAACAPLRRSGLAAMVFLELLGFAPADVVRQVDAARRQLDAFPETATFRAALAPHAPFSVSPELFHAIAAATPGRPISIHLGESPEEMQFLRDGTGAWREMLERLGVWSPAWRAPGCGPIGYVQQLGLLSERLIAVHGVQLADGELHALAAAGATIVTCPRSNRWVGAGDPPVSRFYASGARIALGTDSLASVEDLNLFAEIAAVRRLAPDVAAARILRSATRDGADALGFGADLGTIEPGKRALLLAVDVPGGAADVEEYLVSGIPPGAVRWLGDLEP